MSHYHDYCPVCGVQWAIHETACCKPIRYYGSSERPHKCPVCDGRGTVPPPAGYCNTTADEQCNACNGAGVLWR